MYSFHWFFFLRAIWQNASIGSGDLLALNWRQSIIINNDGLVYWHIYASFGHDELMNQVSIFTRMFRRLFVMVH